MTTSKPATEVLKDFNIELELHDEDIVVEALVIAKVKRLEDLGGNKSSLVIGVSDTMDYITQVGLLVLAQDIIVQDNEDEENND